MEPPPRHYTESTQVIIHVPMREYLDNLEAKRRWLIAELRYTDRILIDNGRLRRQTLPEAK